MDSMKERVDEIQSASEIIRIRAVQLATSRHHMIALAHPN
jgi:hypothetical protein